MPEKNARQIFPWQHLLLLMVLSPALVFFPGIIKAVNPDDVFMKAESEWSRWNWEIAIKDYEAYLDNTPQGMHAPEAYMKLGQYLESANRFTESLDYYRKGLANAKGRLADVFQTEIGAVQIKLGRLDEAAATFQELMQSTEYWDLFKSANCSLKDIFRLKFIQGKDSDKAGVSCGRKAMEETLDILGLTAETEQLDDVLPRSEQQISIKRLEESAQLLGIPARACFISSHNLVNLKPPAILHTNPGHYVLFKGRKDNSFMIYEPSMQSGRDELVDKRQIEKIWTGYALLIDSQHDIGLPQPIDESQAQKIKGGDNWWHTSHVGSPFGISPNRCYIDPPMVLVDTVTLNVLIEETDASWPCMWGRILLRRTYNSDDSRTGMFGNSWRFEFELYLESNPDGSVTLTRESGRIDRFTSNGDGTYASPAGIFDQLIKNPDDTFTLTQKHTWMKFLFDSSGNLVEVFDRNNNSISIERSDGRITGMTVYFKEGYSEQITFAYNSQNLCQNILLPDGRQMSYVFDSSSNLISASNPANCQTNYSYDSNNFITGIDTPIGGHIDIHYTFSSNFNTWVPDSITEPDSGQTTISNDSSSSQYYNTTVTDSLGCQTIYKIDAYTMFTCGVEYQDGGCRDAQYDNFGNLVGLTDQAGNTWHYTYNAPLGELLKIEDPIGNETELKYDSSGDLYQINAPENRSVDLQHDNSHNVTGLNLGEYYIEFKYLYPWGEVTQVNFPGEASYRLFRDQKSLINMATDPEGFNSIYSYYLSGMINERTDANGSFTFYEYDELDRITRISYPDGDLLYSYDCYGLDSATAKDGRSMTFERDAANRVTSFTDLKGFTLGYTYDALGNIASLVYPGLLPVYYEHNCAGCCGGQLAAVQDWLGNRTEYSYDAVGNLVQTVLPNGTGVEYGYDKANHLRSVSNQGVSGVPLPQFGYLLNGLGERVGEVRKNISIPEPDFPSVAFTYDRADRILTVGDDTIEHDANGNLTRWISSSGTQYFSYDYENMLVEFQSPDYSAYYEYDPLKSRILQQDDRGYTSYMVVPNFDLPSVIMTTDENGEVKDYFIHGIGLISRIGTDSEDYYYHYDGLGSTFAITDAAGGLVNSYDFGTFGEPIAVNEAFYNPFRYIGAQGVMTDSSGLYYMRARYYSSIVGRFITKDPIGFLSDNNLYRYALNSPTNFTDPSGEQIEIVVVTVASAILVAVAAYNFAKEYVKASICVLNNEISPDQLNKRVNTSAINNILIPPWVPLRVEP